MHVTIGLLSVLLLAACGQGATDLAPLAPDSPQPSTVALAITGATILPMDGERQLTRHTVLVAAGRIAAVGPDGSVEIPQDATVIDGRGRWVTPGLIDSHTHERALPDWPDDIRGNLIMYLANGITSIVNMGDFTDAMIGVREAVRQGTYPGPDVYVGHFARGSGDGGTAATVVATADAAQRLVERAEAGGYDFIKTYDRIQRDAFDVLVSGGAARDLPVLGHVPAAGLWYSLNNGLVMAVHSGGLLASVRQVSPSMAASRVAEQIRASGAAVGSTLLVEAIVAAYSLDALEGRNGFDRVLAQEGVEFLDDRAIGRWRAMYEERADIRQPFDRRPWLASVRELVKALHDAGVPVLAGSDVIGIPGIVPGFGLHGELKELETAGLSRYAVLQAATSGADGLLQRLRPNQPVGTVAPGYRADLLLLDGDPLVDLATLRRPAGVVAAGRWYPGTWLRAELEKLRTSR